MRKIRVAVVGAGQFGRNHLRVLSGCAGAELVAVVDCDAARAAEAAAAHGCRALTDLEHLRGLAEAAIVATPTVTHAEVGCALLAMGLDVLVEKPIAADMASALRLVDAATRAGRILQVGHLERFNPAVAALERIKTVPLFFEIHRLSPFTPRSLDVDVVLDLMIHDLEIVLSLVGRMPQEVRAAGISVLSDRVDIANARLAFPGGVIANLTASRVSTERVRKLRMFQPGQYVSLDYTRQDAAVFEVTRQRQIAYSRLEVERAEPLRLELEHFLECVRTRREPRVGGAEALRALEVALQVLAKIEEHSRAVAETLASMEASHGGLPPGCER
ncbi:MAG: Gfo/Idh/MocA family oxidoreductase [Bryobacteraceae bacterium]|nr:Gfo/Idh/MocA family oxidoreductase [Bryobacteraceae bacterium]